MCDFKPFVREEEECLAKPRRSGQDLLKLGLCWASSLVWLKSWRAAGYGVLRLSKGKNRVYKGNF